MGNTKQQSPIYFGGINTLRFIAAFCIMIPHSINYLPVTYPPAIQTFLNNLSIGVDLFFIISGFLITYLLLVEKDKTNTISLSKYYVRRILRIFPLYYLTIVIAVLVYIDYPLLHQVNFTSFLYFGGNFWMIKKQGWTIATLNPLWTLNIEEHFYLIIPIILYFIPVHKIKHLLIAIIVGSISYRIYAMTNIKYPWMHIQLHTFSRCDLIAVGGLIACFYNQYKGAIYIKGRYLMLSLIALCTMMCFINFTDYSTFFNAVFQKYLFTIPIVILFIGIVLNERKHPLMVWFKDYKIFNYLGKISFGIYLYHSSVRDFLRRFEFFEELLWLQPVIIVILTLIISWLSYEYFEKRFLSLKTKYVVVNSSNEKK